MGKGPTDSLLLGVMIGGLFCSIVAVAAGVPAAAGVPFATFVVGTILYAAACSCGSTDIVVKRKDESGKEG